MAVADTKRRVALLTGVTGGKHRLTSLNVTSVPTALSVVATPDSASTTAGGTVALQASVTGIAARSLVAQVSAQLPAGWSISPSSHSGTSSDPLKAPTLIPT